MDPKRYARIREVYGAALARPAAERDAFLAGSCEGDDALREEVARLLAAGDVDTGDLRPPAPPRPAPPERIGRYRVERELGEGGMGVVYLARRQGNPVAIKVLHPWLHPAGQGLERFHREADAGIALRDEHVVRTLEAGSEPDGTGGTRHFLVMEYVEGRTLREMLDRLGPLPENLIREIARQAAQGVAAIHAAGLLHRDLKPENILLSDRQQVRVMDLGIAKALEDAPALTAEGQFLGSLAYAAPEQLDGSALGAAADLYALGVVLYELASGTNPFRAADPAATIRAHLDHEPAPLADPVSRFLGEVVDTLLAKDPARRFRTARELAIILEEGESSPWWRARKRRPAAVSIPVERGGAITGRARELAALRSAWTAARKGKGSVVLLSGPEGVGKSRLLAEWLDGVKEADVFYGAFSPGGPGDGLVRAVHAHLAGRDPEEFVKRRVEAPALQAALVGRLGAAGAAASSPGLFPAALATLVRGSAAVRPILWIADDVQFAGLESVRSLEAMARVTRGMRALLVVAGSAATLAKLASAVGDDADTATIELAGLDRDAVTDLLDREIGSRPLAERIAKEVAELSDGVPLVVCEIVRAMREQGLLGRDDAGRVKLLRPLSDLEIPGSLHDLVARRVERLDEDARRVLDAAAVVGPAFDGTLVAEVLKVPLLRVLQTLAEIERTHGLVRAAGRDYRFEHHLVAEALRDALPSALRAELHALVAEAMARKEGDAPAGEAAVRIVNHHLRGSRPAGALPLLDAAFAALALRTGAHAALAHRALAIDGLLETAHRIDILLLLANDLDILVRRDEQGKVAEEALALARAHGDQGLLARALLAVSSSEFGRFRPERTLPILDEVLAIGRALGDASMQAQAQINLGTSLGRLDRREEARAALARARDLAKESGERRFEAAALLNDALQAKDLGAAGEAERLVQEAIRLAEECGHRRVLCYAHANLGLLWAEAGRIDEALPHIGKQLELARELGDARAENIAVSNRALALLHEGRLREARADYEHQMELARLVGEKRGMVLGHVNIAEIERLAGRAPEANAHLRRAAELVPDVEASLAARVAGMASEVARQQGDLEEAERRAREAVRIAGETNDRRAAWHGHCALGAAREAAGDRDGAAAAYRGALAAASDLSTLRLAAGVPLALLEGDVAAAERAMKEHGPRAALATRLEARYALWRATGGEAHREAAREDLNTLRREAPNDVTHADFDTVPIYRALDGGAP